MNQRTFIIVLAVIAALLIGWVVFNTTQAEAAPVSIDDITTKWWGSGHADGTSEAFVHWNEDEPAVVPERCAKCHSASGFIDFVGADGSAAGSVEMPGKINDVLACITCHSDPAHALDNVTMQSGNVIEGTGSNSVCMNCHGGMGTASAVDKKVGDLGLDEQVPEAALIGNHYFAAAAVHEGADAADGYQYEGKTYVGVFEHAEGVSTCTECHDPHSTHINDIPNSDANLCSTCHSNVAGWADYKKVSVSKVDFDGNGTVDPIYDEIEGVKTKLLQALWDYSKETTGSAFVFNSSVYPYTFIDTNEDGQASDEESAFPNSFKAWTPRMLKAAYNFSFTTRDPGAYVHNAKYVLQLMYDSIEDLGGSTAGMVRP